MSKSLGLASFKGGVGKTMIAYSLAERATASGLRVMLLDFDPNEGPMALATLRDYSLPTWSMSSVPLTASGLRALEDHLKSDDLDLVICDLPGADSTLFLRLLGNLDLILSPLGPGVSDLFVAAEFAATLQRFNLPRMARWQYTPARQGASGGIRSIAPVLRLHKALPGAGDQPGWHTLMPRGVGCAPVSGIPTDKPRTKSTSSGAGFPRNSS